MDNIIKPVQARAKVASMRPMAAKPAVMPSRAVMAPSKPVQARPMPEARPIVKPAAPMVRRAVAVKAAPGIVGPSVNPAPRRNVNPQMRSMKPMVSTIADMPKRPYGK